MASGGCRPRRPRHLEPAAPGNTQARSPAAATDRFTFEVADSACGAELADKAR
jgi:hypothetical protein